MTYSMSTAAARKASKKTQHVRSAGDWTTLILLVAGALLVLFPLLVLTVNAFKTSADYNATGPLSLPKHFTMEGIISFWTTTNFPLKFWNSFIISLVVAVAAVVLSVLNSFALGIGKVKGNTWIVLGIMLANMMPQEALLYPLYTMFKQVGHLPRRPAGHPRGAEGGRGHRRRLSLANPAQGGAANFLADHQRAVRVLLRVDVERIHDSDGVPHER